jgi:hypothetical protein
LDRFATGISLRCAVAALLLDRRCPSILILIYQKVTPLSSKSCTARMGDVHARLFEDSVTGRKSRAAERVIESARLSDYAAWHALLAGNCRLTAPAPDPRIACRICSSDAPSPPRARAPRPTAQFVADVPIPIRNDPEPFMCALPALDPRQVAVPEGRAGRDALHQLAKTCAVSRTPRLCRPDKAQTLRHIPVRIDLASTV